MTSAALAVVIVPIVALVAGLTGHGKLLLWSWITGLVLVLLLIVPDRNWGYFGNVPRAMLSLYFLWSLLSLFLYYSMSKLWKRRAERHSQKC